MAGPVEELGGRQHCFGRDAAHVHASPADYVGLHKGDPGAGLGRVDGGGECGRSGAQNDEVVVMLLSTDQRLKSGWSFRFRLDRGDLVSGLLHRLSQLGVGGVLGLEHGVAPPPTDLGRRSTCRHERLRHRLLTVFAGHALDLHRLHGHGNLLHIRIGVSYYQESDADWLCCHSLDRRLGSHEGLCSWRFVRQFGEVGLACVYALDFHPRSFGRLTFRAAAPGQSDTAKT